MEEQTKEMIAPKQWVYVIERKENHVKIGMSANPHERIKTLERAGGFHVKRKQLFGPFQNGYQVENEVHKKISSNRIHSEWFALPFEDATSITDSVAKLIGNTEHEVKKSSSGFNDGLIRMLFPELDEMVEFYESYTGEKITVSFDDGKIWAETESGLVTLDFLAECVRAESLRIAEKLIKEYQPNEND